MGITIHWNMQFVGSEDLVRIQLDRLTDPAELLGFSEIGAIQELSYARGFNETDLFTPVGEDGQPEEGYRWAKIQLDVPSVMFCYDDTPAQKARKERKLARLREQRLKTTGLFRTFWFGPGCEPTNLGFTHVGRSRKWTGHGFTKTQYAQDFVRAHVSVCALLKAVEQQGVEIEVSDEGDFWKTGDITQLIDSGEQNMALITSVTDALKKFGFGVVTAGGSVDE